MSFASQYATLIWDVLYDVSVPDQLTQSPEYLKRFGAHVTGNREVDAMLARNTTHVKIPVAKILSYYLDGIEITIHSRDDMLKIHKDIELYLGEWQQHLKYDINLEVNKNKALILGLEKLSKELYSKAKPREVINKLFDKSQFGLYSPLDKAEEEKKEHQKPDYEGIGQLVRSKVTKPVGRF